MHTAINRKRIILYILIGIVYLVLWLIIDVSQYDMSFPVILLNNLWRLIFIIAINYLFFEHTIPFIRKKNVIVAILLFVFFFWIQLMLYSFGVYGWRAIGILLHLYNPFRTFSSIMKGIEYNFPAGFSSLFIFGFCSHAYDHLLLKQSAQQLRIEKQQAELNYLKSQTNPHFLFNTLNNIYSLARAKSDLAPEAIMRLSKMLRYMLYETGGDYVAVEQELRIIGDYIELEKLRYDETLTINYNHDVEDMKQALPPLLLVPLVENAFKHGVSETRGNPFVDIHLSIERRQLKFIVRNSTDASAEQKLVKENIGLSNLRRQLELLYKNFDLTVQPGNGVFTATLIIDLSSHV